MKKKDLLILSILRRNCRTSLTSISRKTRMPVSTIYDRLKVLEGKVIKKHAVIVDFSSIGYVVKAHIMLCVDRSQKDEFAAYMEKHQSVNSFYRINNGYDFLAELICRDINELERFLEQLQGRFKVKDKKTFFIVEELKREAFLSDSLFLGV